jgi:hypothetical protein
MRVRLYRVTVELFLILAPFNQYSRNEADRNLFPRFGPFHVHWCGSNVKLTRLSCSSVTTESRHLLQLFDTVEPSRTMCTSVLHP